MALTTNRSDERRHARRSELIVRLLRVYRAASLLATGAEPAGSGVYRIMPGDVLHLRHAVAQAKEVINEEGVVGCP